MRVFAWLCLSFAVACGGAPEGWSAPSASTPGLPPAKWEERLKKESCDNLNNIMSDAFQIAAKTQKRIEEAAEKARRIFGGSPETAEVEKKERAYIEKFYIADTVKLYRDAESEYKSRCGELRRDLIEIKRKHPNNYIH